VIEEDNKIPKKDASDESESEIIDFDENINTLSFRCKVTDFNPNSNKKLMRKCILQGSPVMNSSKYNLYGQIGSKFA
jgi:hypothetical protein